MANLTVAAVKYLHTGDIDPDATKAGGDLWEGLVDACVTAAQTALQTPPRGYSPTQRNSLDDLFASMRATHRGIRSLIKLGDEKPESVDALVLARLQLEGLYTLCLLVEGPQRVDRFVREAWKHQYIQWMLVREETKELGRFPKSLDNELQRLLTLAEIWGITNEERLTIEFDQLNVQPPPGFVRQPIKRFPTPGQLIDELPQGPKRKMLERLYLEYQELCIYAHGRPIAGFGKAIFDGHSVARKEFGSFYGESYVHEQFQKTIVGQAQIYSLISVAQATAELTTLYPDNVQLRAAATKAWNELHGAHLLVNAVWNIRTKALLGVIG